MPPRGTIAAIAAVVAIAGWFHFTNDDETRTAANLVGRATTWKGTPVRITARADGADGVCIALAAREGEGESCIADGGSFAGWDGGEGTSVGGLVPARARRVEVRFAGHGSVAARLFRLPAGMADTQRVYLAYGPPRSEAARVRVLGARGETLDSYTARFTDRPEPPPPANTGAG